MALIDGIKRQLRSVIEWRDPDPDSLWVQWTENGDEIKNASKLIVGPGQGCIFVYQGQVKAVVDQPCLVNLATENVPFWTTIKKFMQFFESEHKVAIYFFRTTRILDQKWGTTSLIKYDDPVYHFPVGLKAYGNYSYQISDPAFFFAGVVGSHRDVGIDEFRKVIASRIVQPISDYLAEGRFSYADVDRNRDEIARGIAIKLSIVFRKLGFSISDFRIEGTDFDEDTLRRIGRIADLKAEAQAAQAVGLDYARVQQLEALRDAAGNEGGAAGAALGLGAGVSLGQSFARTLANVGEASDGQGDRMIDKLTQLKQMLDGGLISQADYDAKKQELLAKL